MSHIVLLQDFSQMMVTKMRAPIANQSSWDSKTGKDVLLQELDHYPGVIFWRGYGLHPFGDVIHSYQDVDIPV